MSELHEDQSAIGDVLRSLCEALDMQDSIPQIPDATAGPSLNAEDSTMREQTDGDEPASDIDSEEEDSDDVSDAEEFSDADDTEAMVALRPSISK